MQEGKQNENLKLFSSQFRKQHLDTFGSMGRLSIIQGHGVLALRHGPSTGAGQKESPLQEQTSKLEAGSAGRQAKSKFEASL